MVSMHGKPLATTIGHCLSVGAAALALILAASNAVGQSMSARALDGRQMASFSRLSIDPAGPSKFSGTGTAGTRVIVKAGASILGNALVGPDGRWQLVIPAALSRTLAGRDHRIELVVRGEEFKVAQVVDTWRIAVPGHDGKHELEPDGKPSRSLSAGRSAGSSSSRKQVIAQAGRSRQQEEKDRADKRFEQIKRDYKAMLAKLVTARAMPPDQPREHDLRQPDTGDDSVLDAGQGNAGLKLFVVSQGNDGDALQTTALMQLPAGRVLSRDEIRRAAARRSEMQLAQSTGDGAMDAAGRWLDRADRDFNDVMRKLSVDRKPPRLDDGAAKPGDGARVGRPGNGGAAGRETPDGSFFSWDWLRGPNDTYDSVMRKLSRRPDRTKDARLTREETEDAARRVEQQRVEERRRDAARRVLIDPTGKPTPGTDAGRGRLSDAAREAEIARRAEIERQQRDQAKLFEERRLERMAERELLKQEERRKAADARRRDDEQRMARDAEIRRRAFEVERQRQAEAEAEKQRQAASDARTAAQEEDLRAQRDARQELAKRQIADAKRRADEKRLRLETERDLAAQRRLNAEQVAQEQERARREQQRAEQELAAREQQRSRLQEEQARQERAQRERDFARQKAAEDELRRAELAKTQAARIAAADEARRAAARKAAEARLMAQRKADAAAKAAAEAAARIAEETRQAEMEIARAQVRQRQFAARIAEERRAVAAATKATERASAERRIAEDRRRMEEERRRALALRRDLEQRRQAEARALRQAERARRAATATAEGRRAADAARTLAERRDAERRLNFSLREAEDAAANAIEAARTKLARQQREKRRIAQGLPPRRDDQGSSPGQRVELPAPPTRRPSAGRPSTRRPSTPRRGIAGQRDRCAELAGRRIEIPGWYIVARGDTLWRIAERHYRDGSAHRLIYRANQDRIDDPDEIMPCQKVRLPLPEPAG